MSIKNRSKDNLKEHGGIELATQSLAPRSSDPLRFWTNHPTDNAVVDLHVFAEGQFEKPRRGKWSGPFSGRPELIAELAPAIEARLTLTGRGSRLGYLAALRAFWRVLEALETRTSEGRALERLTSVKDLTHLHEVALLRSGIDSIRCTIVLAIVNDARRLMRLGPLLWTISQSQKPSRKLIPDSQVKALKIAIKRDWENVRTRWARNDAIMRGDEPDTLNEYQKENPILVQEYADQNEKLRRNWLHFDRIRQITGRAMPSAEQLYEGFSPQTQMRRGLDIRAMRGIAFPTVEDADIAIHAALMGSGWNPSTLIFGIDATLPERIFQHPKDSKQYVLTVDIEEDDEEVTMQGSKGRAGGRSQFCMGLKKNPDAPPMIVATYLQRTAGLRELLRQDVREAHVELQRLKDQGAHQKDIERQFNLLQTLQQGLRNVWLYVARDGKINWVDGRRWRRYPAQDAENISYLGRMIDRLNAQRVTRGEPEIPRVVPADFRDMFARWVHLQSGGNVIAVMFALGHAGLRSTNHYLDNNIFNSENDEAARRFMTHLFEELDKGRVDLTILSQLVRNGPLTTEMQERLVDYRNLMRSRVKAGCVDPKNPPVLISPDHVEGKWCGTQRCLRNCPHARFLPESLDGVAMRTEELVVMSDHLPLDVWMRDGFDQELESAEYLLVELYPQDAVEEARMSWRQRILSGKHVVPGVGLIREQGVA